MWTTSNCQGMLHVAFVRSPYAHAKDGVGGHLRCPGDGWGPGGVHRFGHSLTSAILVTQVAVGKLRPLLAGDKVNHLGEAVAMVVADSRYGARDGRRRGRCGI